MLSYGSNVFSYGRPANNYTSTRDAKITNAEDLAMVLKSIKDATNIMSEDCTATLPVIAPMHAQLLHDIEAGFCGNAAPIPPGIQTGYP